MPMPKGKKIDKEDPEFLKRKSARDSKKIEQKKQTSVIFNENVDERIKAIRSSLEVDASLENSLSNPSNAHIDISNPKFDALSKKWTLTEVPYIIIFAILFNVNKFLVKEAPELEIDFSDTSIINRRNVGAVRSLCHFYACANLEIGVDLDLQYYVNQAFRHYIQLKKPARELYKSQYAAQQNLSISMVQYNGETLSSIDVANKVDEFFKLSTNLETFGYIYAELIGQNRVNNCYISIKPNFAWSLDLSYFKFSKFGIWLFVAIDLATRKVMHSDYFTSEENPNGLNLFQSIENGFTKNETVPEILHTDQAGYFLGQFDDLLREKYSSIRLSKTKYGLNKQQKKTGQNQVVEAFFSSFKKMVVADLGSAFFENIVKEQVAINELRKQVTYYNQHKIHKILLNPPDQDYFNKVILECIRTSVSGSGPDSLTSDQIDNLLITNGPITPSVILESDLKQQTNSESQNGDSNNFIFIETTGRILDENMASDASQNSSISAQPKIKKLVKQEVIVSSKVIIDSLQLPDNINEIIKVGLEQFPKDFFERNIDPNLDVIGSNVVMQCFFYAIKQHVLKGENIHTPLAAYLQDSLPNLIRGPGRKKRYDTNYLYFLDIQFYLDEIVTQVFRVYYQFVMRVQIIVLYRQNEIQSKLQLEEHRRTQDMILASRNEMSQKVTNLKQELEKVTFELQARNRAEEQARLAKEKRKNYNRLPPRDPITDKEFLKLLEHCINMTKVDNCPPTVYKAGFMKICYFLLMITGMRVSNLLYIKNRDIDRLINDTTNTIIDIPLIKNNNRKFLQIAVDKQIRKIYLLNEPYNLARDFYKMIERVQLFLSGKSKSTVDILDLPFACSFSSPDKEISREYLTKTLNDGLEAINVDKFGNPLSTLPKKSHSFRVRVIDEITKNYGIEAARDFVNHEDIRTTDRYTRSRLPEKTRRDIANALVGLSKRPKTARLNQENTSENSDVSPEI